MRPGRRLVFVPARVALQALARLAAPALVPAPSARRLRSRQPQWRPSSAKSCVLYQAFPSSFHNPKTLIGCGTPVQAGRRGVPSSPAIRYYTICLSYSPWRARPRKIALLPRGWLAGEEREDFENFLAFGRVQTEILPITLAGGEARGTVRFHEHSAWFGAAEVAMCRTHGLENGGEIPRGPVVGHLVISAVGFRDRVRARVCEIVFDAAGGIEELAPDFEAAEYDGSWPVLEDGLGGGNVDADVVLWFSTAEIARHGDDQRNLLFGDHNPLGGIQQRGEVGAKAGLHDHHLFARLRQEAAQERGRGFGGTGALGGRGAQSGCHVAITSTALELFDRGAYGQIAVAIEAIDHPNVRDSRWIRVGEGDTNQFALTAIAQRVQHGERQGVIDVVAHVGIEDHRTGGEADARNQANCD